jgi:hypothetical protein
MADGVDDAPESDVERFDVLRKYWALTRVLGTHAGRSPVSGERRYVEPSRMANLGEGT